MRLILIAAMALPLPAQQAELTPAWDIRKTLESLVEQTGRLDPLLDQMKPEQWVAEGASAGYVDQWKQVRAESGYLVRNTELMSEDPEKMTAVLDVFFRLQSLESMLNSLNEGLRRYQNPALAGLLQSVIAENNANRMRLRDYMVELVASKEAELRIMGEEAQRCRESLIRLPRPGAGRTQ